ncbi:Hypothetical protein HVR_LOCUS509 [uncultured virus]|nr:Hypothetical protein HVR_LOCUS509 [uncultured virus]
MSSLYLQPIGGPQMNNVNPQDVSGKFRIETMGSIIPPDVRGKYSSAELPAPPADIPKSCDAAVLRKRTDQDFSNEVISIIRTVTAKMNTLPVGTFKYKIFKYPSDIDIFEKLEGCCTFNNAKLNASQAIQHIVYNVVNNRSGIILFTEFKAGYDDRFKIYTGNINGTVEDHNPIIIRRDITNLYQAQLLSCVEYQEFMALVKDNPSINDVILLNEKIRDLWVIRWTAEEILNGYKTLRGNYKLFLDVALTQGSIVKLDTIARIGSGIDSRYVEVTNFFLIIQRDRFGNIIVLSEELGDYAQSLLGDVYKYYDSNILKSIKRLWMYLAYKGSICDLSVFTELFSSDVALYSQIVGDLEVAIELLESKLSYDRNFLYDSLNRRLSKLQSMCINGPINFRSTDLVTTLVKIRECVINIINNETRNWLASRNIDIISLTKQ